MFTDVSQESTASVFRVDKQASHGESVKDIGREIGALRNILKKEEGISSDTIVPVCKTTQHHILKDCNLTGKQ
jgi:hypothetical protein